MNILEQIQAGVVQAVQHLYGTQIEADSITLNTTRKEFEGDYTVVVFPYTKVARKKPEQIGEEIGHFLVEKLAHVTHFNVIKGFLNLTVSDTYWHQFLLDIYSDEQYGQQPSNSEKVMVEFSSPNTNKPLHLGHIRNILLGWSSAKILAAAGYEVVKVQIVNDRGIAICKSMLAWEKYGEGATPQSTQTKSDHFVGSFYVLFEQKFQEEYTKWQASSEGVAAFAKRKDEKQDQAAFFKAYKNTYFNAESALGKEAKAMLRNWEDGDPETVALWKKMNQWVYHGFDATYENLGVTFDKLYYESNTYLLGKDLIQTGLQTGQFYQKDDGSVWIDLEDVKLDHKLVLRSDGTSVYMTQDIGTAQLRYDDFKVDRMVYVVADEQDYHFKVLFEIMKRLGAPYANDMHHLSYGMVDLPTGKMKSREGTVVDADDLMAEVIQEAKTMAAERGNLAELSESERNKIHQQVGLAALKFFIIKVQPRKRMTFDPKESVDMQGQTGPYVQNAYVRIQSVLRKAGTMDLEPAVKYQTLETAEKDLIAMLFVFPEIIRVAAAELDPSNVANYCFDLAKAYHRFYHDYSILRAESDAAKSFRLALSTSVANVLRFGMDLLGIEMPDQM